MQETEQKPLDRYSYSKISCYGQCKFKFKLKYLDKNFLFSANIATDFGSLVHSIEEDIAKAIQAEQPINYVVLENKFIIECRKIALKYPTEFFSEEKSGRTYREKMYLYLERLMGDKWLRDYVKTQTISYVLNYSKLTIESLTIEKFGK